VKAYPSDDGAAAFVSLARGEDLMEGLNRAVAALGFEAATLQVIGALEQGAVGYLQQEKGEYKTLTTGHVEISAGVGNVSVRDGKPWVHLHLVLSESDGRCVGGHAMEGCRAFVVEAYFRRLDGPAPIRQDVPGMPLKVWPGT
jgi:predicted DNA-binding protein with PD1-like motif